MQINNRTIEKKTSSNKINQLQFVALVSAFGPCKNYVAWLEGTLKGICWSTYKYMSSKFPELYKGTSQFIHDPLFCGEFILIMRQGGSNNITHRRRQPVAWKVLFTTGLGAYW